MAWIVLRTSAQFTRPLAELTEEITQIAISLSGKSAKYGGENDATPIPTSSNEIENLALSVYLLKEEVIRSERIEKLIENERARAEVASKMAALGEMSAGVAHEINNPISIIHAVSDELQELASQGKSSPEETQRLSLIIKDTATRVASIVRSLLRLARDAKEDPMDWASLKSIIDDAVVLVRDQTQKSQIWLSVNGPQPDVRVYCRRAQISQALLNLLNNAIDAVESCKEKRISVDVSTADESTIQVSVTDTGPGIAQSVRGRIMQPFVTTKPPGRGTGLGLSISKRILEEHRGWLKLDESRGSTCFTFAIPKESRELPIASLDDAASARNIEPGSIPNRS